MMCAYAVAEFIPADWRKVNVVLYHGFGDTFDLVEARIVIRCAPQSAQMGLKDED